MGRWVDRQALDSQPLLFAFCFLPRCSAVGNCCPGFTDTCILGASCQGFCDEQAPSGCYCDDLLRLAYYITHTYTEHSDASGHPSV